MSSSPSPALLEEPPLRAIIRLAAPTTGVMMLGAVSNILYTFFVSWLGADAIAAVSLVFPISLIMMTLMGGGLGAGISSALSRALGAGDKAGAREIAEHALFLSAVLTVVATGTMVFGARPIFAAMGGVGDVLDHAVAFARILFGGLFLTFLTATLDSLMRAEGNARIPALCGAVSLGLQIVLTPILMFNAGFGLIGAPLATLFGQSIGLIPRLVFVFGGRGHVTPRLLPRRVVWVHIESILRVGVPASLSALIHYIGIMVLTGLFARYGTKHLAAYGLCTRLDFILFTLGYGVATATITLVGMAAGAGRPEQVRRYVKQAVMLAAVMVLAPALVVVIWPDLWMGMFTADPEILAVGRGYFRIVGLTYAFVVTSMIYASSFQALRRATVPLMTMSVRVVGVLLVSIALTRMFQFGESSIFGVIAAGNLLSNLVLFLLFRRALAGMERGENAIQ